MARKPRIVGHLSSEELWRRYRSAGDAVARTHYQIVWLLSRGENLKSCAEQVGYSARWVSAILRRYNTEGPEALGDRRHGNRGQEPLLSPAEQDELRQAMTREPPEGGLWNGPKVAAWIGRKLGRDNIAPRRGWVYLRRLGYTLQRPRPAHADRADAEAQAAFKKNCWRGSPPSRRGIPTCRSRPGLSTSTGSA